jgi:hypothetical protein
MAKPKEVEESKDVEDGFDENWHEEYQSGYECFMCGSDISPSDHHDTGTCISCLESEDFDRG